MTRRRFRRFFAASAALLGLVVTASVATPWPFFLSAWQTAYPASMTDDNVINGTGAGCQVCHEDSNGGDGWNGYGWDLRVITSVTGDINAAMAMVEPLDSDLDPTASSNLDEITASTQPGWTDGPNNTIFYASGSTLGAQSPPAGILGVLDPAGGNIGAAYCSPAVANSTGNPGAISASGSTSVSDNDVTLTASDLPADFGYFLNSMSQGSIMPPASNGVLCLSGSIGRHNQPGLVQPGPTISITLDLTSIPTPNAFVAINAGETWNFQAWYRDTGSNNFTDGVSILFL